MSNKVTQKITPFLWFDYQAEEGARKLKQGYEED
jgi:predicted 3-demethylubiquinone-9 3-methyltransferase (glyoxalase superfamily)